MARTRTKILVVGGGPAGSTTATLLARQGLEVVLMDREKGPRYHIGESLLPSCLKVFDLLGIRERIEKYGFVQKDGGYFDWGGQRWEIAFNTPSTPLYGFQVIRSEFDSLLLQHARSQGVDVREGSEVEEIHFDASRASSVTYKSGDDRDSLSFDWIVDASGRAGLLSTRYLRNRRYNEAFRNVAVWGYWLGAKRPSDGPPGAIVTCSIAYGWIWCIPLHDGTLSIGVVLHRSKLQELRKHLSMEEIYHSAVQSSEVVSELLHGARLREQLRTESDYSYTGDAYAGPGYLLAGDAACFLDPLLSTGVHLAMFSGLLAAACIGSILRNEVSEWDATEFYTASYRRSYLRMLVVVSAFYQSHRGRDLFFRQAQQLTKNDYSEAELYAAFRNIISGVEDLSDVESVQQPELLDTVTRIYEEHYEFVRKREDWGAMSLEEIDRGMRRLRIVNAVQEEFSLTPETAVNGLYVDITSFPMLKHVNAARDASLAAVDSAAVGR